MFPRVTGNGPNSSVTFTYWSPNRCVLFFIIKETVRPVESVERVKSHILNVIYNTFNVLNGLVFFVNGLKSNGLESLMDK